MLKRKAYEKLLEWKQQQAGKTAVLIEGARRVGKSTLAKEFGLNEYKSCLVIDFFQAPDEVKQYFRDYSNDFDALFLYLSAYYSVELFDRESLFVFDEVQMFSFARGLVKYLVADGRYDYVETGSLLSIKQNIQDIVVPSEEQTLELAPFDFEEFLCAMGEKPLAQLIGSSFDSLKPLPDNLRACRGHARTVPERCRKRTHQPDGARLRPRGGTGGSALPEAKRGRCRRRARKRGDSPCGHWEPRRLRPDSRRDVRCGQKPSLRAA